MMKINKHFVMGFNIGPTHPFGFNYLGGKLLALLACSYELKNQFDHKYGTDLKYFETTSLYGTTKGMSMYDGLKPFLRHIGDTQSDFLPLFHDDEFRDFFWWFNERNNNERLISADKSSKKLKIMNKMISIIKNSLQDKDKLEEFNESIKNAKTLTEKKRYYLGDFRHTAQQAIGCYLDLFNPKAAPRVVGTVFECLVACALNRVCALPIGSGTVQIPNAETNIQIDLGIRRENKLVLLAATKTSTRERLSQPFVQKFIVDRAIKTPPKSILVVIGDVQRLGDKRVQHTFTAGQFHLYWKYLTPMDGVYYIDVPPQAETKAFEGKIKRLSDLFFSELQRMVG